MFNAIVALGYGVITFAILIGAGSIVLHEFGGAVAECPYSCEGGIAVNWTYNATGCVDALTGDATAAVYGSPVVKTWNSSLDQCVNSSGHNGTDPYGSAYNNINYVLTELGSGGLAGWVPAIIALSVGLLFLGAFMVGKGRSY